MEEEKLLSLLQKKKGFFESILDLTENEQHLSLKAWISQLEQKKILLSCIEEIDQELLPYRETLHTLSQEIDDELEEMKKVIERILRLDSINCEKRKNQFRL